MPFRYEPRMPHHDRKDRIELALRIATVLLLLLIFLHGHGWAQGVKPTGQNAQPVVVQDSGGNKVGTNGSGNSLNVQCTSGCAGGGGGGGTSQADTSTFTQGTTAMTPVGGEYTTSLSNCVAGGACTWRFTVDRAGYVNISHYNGSAVGAGNPFYVTPGTGATWAVTQSTSPWVTSVSTWAGGTLGAMANYGTSPGAVLVPGVNAFITNVPAVSQSGNWTARIVGNAGAILDAAGQNIAAPANWLQAGCQFNTAPTTITTGNGSPCQMDASANMLVNVKVLPGVNIANIGGSSVASVGGGVMPVGGAPSTAAGAALSLFQNSAVTTAQVVKASVGNLYGFVVPAVSGCFVQFMNTASSPVLGTNAVFSVPITAQQTWMPNIVALNNFTTGISVGLSTTYNGSTACATSGPVIVFYK